MRPRTPLRNELPSARPPSTQSAEIGLTTLSGTYVARQSGLTDGSSNSDASYPSRTTVRPRSRSAFAVARARVCRSARAGYASSAETGRRASSGSPPPTRTIRRGSLPCTTVVRNRWSGPSVCRAAVEVSTFIVEAGVTRASPWR